MTRRRSPNRFPAPLFRALFEIVTQRPGGLRAVFHRASRQEDRLSRTYVRYSSASRHRGACRSSFRAVKHDAAVMLRDFGRPSLSAGTAASRNGGRDRIMLVLYRTKALLVPGGRCISMSS